MPRQSAPKELEALVPDLVEVITHLSVHAGRPNPMTAVSQLEKIADERDA
ncbi:hypothetical protein [Streptomyces sp. NPDC057287]